MPALYLYMVFNMEIKLYVNHSEANKIHKIITDEETLVGTLRNESNVVEPTIVIQHTNPTVFNYVYIPDFHRYYFINEITSIRNSLWTIKLNSDPLMSFSQEILACPVILNETSETGKSRYLQGRNWVNNCKNKTDILTFSNGLNNEGEYILITAGG